MANVSYANPPGGLNTLKVNAASGSLTSFTPTSGKGYLIAIAAGTDGSGTAASITGVAWASGGTIAVVPGCRFQAGAFSPEISFWYCKPSQQGSGAITVTGNAHVTSIVATVLEITSDNAESGTFGAVASSSATANTISITPISTGGQCFYVSQDLNEGPTPTAAAATTLIDNWTDNGQLRVIAAANSTTTGGTAQTIGITNTLTANNQLALELAGPTIASTKVHCTTTGADSGVTAGSGTKRLADWTAGASSTLQNINAVAGPTNGVQLTDSTTAGTNGTAESWYTHQLAAVTIAGQIVASLWGRESATTSNAAPVIGVERCSADGTVLSTIVDWTGATSQGATEFATTAGGATKTCTVAAAQVVDTTLSDGDRLRLTLWIRDASTQGGAGTMASGGNCQLYVNGPVGAAG